ncbi:MAG: MurR/RpiR family transcriptional regulator [Acidimicrobiia bacterium]|nr:MurR/RpiR family transcriptional regulator [Acidimicrobiia bacterium]
MSPTATPDLIAAVGDRLTPAERRIAEAVLAEPTLLAFGTVSDLAERVGTSRPSVVRFANKLGFDGYTQLQEHVRSGLSHRLSRPSDRIREDDVMLPARASLEGGLASVFEAAEGDRLAGLAAPIVGAANVWIISGETSRAGAHALHSGLTMVRPGVHLVEDHSMGQDLSHAAPGDVAVVFDFFRYRRRAVRAARTLASQGVEVVAITDGPLSPLATLTDHWCELRVPAIGPFDSSVPAVAMAELLVAYVADQLHDEATARLDHTEDLWTATETFLPET